MSDRVQLDGEPVVVPPEGEVVDELRLLAAATGGAMMVFAWAGDSIQCGLREDPPPQPLTVPPVDCTALLPGTEAALHVLMAWLPADVLERRLAKLGRTPFPIRSRSLLALRLARVRATGYDVHAGGVRGEVTSIAAPVRAGAEMTGALALIAPSVYLEELDVGTITADILRLASGLSHASPLHDPPLLAREETARTSDAPGGLSG